MSTGRLDGASSSTPFSREGAGPATPGAAPVLSSSPEWPFGDPIVAFSAWGERQHLLLEYEVDERTSKVGVSTLRHGRTLCGRDAAGWGFGSPGEWDAPCAVCSAHKRRVIYG